MAIEAKKISSNGSVSGTVLVSDAIFGAPLRDYLVYDSLLAQLAGRRQGTAKTKARSEVSGGGRKPFKQKGTGNARQGSIRSPNYPGGGTVFGPLPRSYEQFLPRTLKNEALKSLLSKKNAEGQIFVCESIDLKEAKTKSIAKFMASAKISKALFVDMDNETLKLSTRNLPKAHYSDVRSLNVFDMLKFENVVFLSTSLKQLEERVSK